MSSPIRCRVPPQQGQALVLEVDQDLDPRQVRRQGAQVAPARSRRPRCIAALGGGFLCRLGRGDGLLEVFQAKLQLVGVEPLRATAELATLQPPDQEPQLLDLGLSRLMLRIKQYRARSVTMQSIAFCWVMTSVICCRWSRSGPGSD